MEVRQIALERRIDAGSQGIFWKARRHFFWRQPWHCRLRSGIELDQSLFTSTRRFHRIHSRCVGPILSAACCESIQRKNLSAYPVSKSKLSHNSHAADSHLRLRLFQFRRVRYYENGPTTSPRRLTKSISCFLECYP